MIIKHKIPLWPWLFVEISISIQILGHKEKILVLFSKILLNLVDIGDLLIPVSKTFSSSGSFSMFHGPFSLLTEI